MTQRIIRVMGCFALVLSVVSAARPAAAEEPNDIRSPEQRSVRHSAYALPKDMWSFDASIFGVTGEDVYGSLGVKRGFGAGLELELNVAHFAVGLFNVGAHWSFLDTKYIAVSATVGFTYGHGAWIWIVGPLAKDLLQDTDLITVPFEVSASSMVLDWLQLDLSVVARYATIWGTLGDGGSFYANAEIGANQIGIRPGVRAFLSDATALELFVDLPFYTSMPYEGELSLELRNKGWERSGSDRATVPLGDTWKFEAGLRSRFTPWMFGTVRLHYGRTNKLLYLTTVNPSVSVEFRM
ncbi:MAG TPA: hypothetical protein VJV78_11840 [Polyangiales bacterium]|nr:hypothetical protein [Polyangiales bacterium]